MENTMKTTKKSWRIEGTNEASKAYIARSGAAYIVNATTALGAKRMAARFSGMSASLFIVVGGG
jgi:hypothetical protein